MKDFYFDGSLLFLNFSKIELDNHPSDFGPDSYSKIVTNEDLFHSSVFSDVVDNFLVSLKSSDDSLFDFFSLRFKNLHSSIIALTSLCLYVPLKKIYSDYPQYKEVLSDGGTYLLEFIDRLFAYWLNINRFGFFVNQDPKDDCLVFSKRMLLFKKSILDVYYSIKRNIIGEDIFCKSDIPAGVVAGLELGSPIFEFDGAYSYLSNVLAISKVSISFPFLTNTKRNKRIGVYKESDVNLATNLSIDSSSWLCYPFYVGTSLVYFYFDICYLNDVIGLANLFKKANVLECKNKKPDILIVFGGNKGNSTGTYYEDKKNGFLVGYVSKIDDSDYFGYVKKLVLTLHNLRMIHNGCLPIHGSMVSITMKSGEEKNLIIMGDSGAGKSESIEAFRQLSSEYLKSIKVIFDDMGTLFFENNKVVACGTETGAFVRIDDLDSGYAFSHIYDSIVMNASKTNARIIYQCTPYQEVIKKWPIDIFLYANNYEKTDCGLVFFDNYQKMIDVCEEGKRKAKGTTGEVGLVSSYFANPFGPVQTQAETHKLVELMFSNLEKQGTKLGVLYTQLAVEGENKLGPSIAAKFLFDWINRN